MVQLDLDGIATHANDAAGLILGYTPEEIVGNGFHTLVHHSHADGSRYPREECPSFVNLKTGTASTVEGEVFWTKNRESFPVEYTTAPCMVDGQPLGVVLVFRDISLRREAQRFIELKQRQFHALFECAPDALVIVDEDGAIAALNQQAVKLFGYNANELSGQPMEVLMPERFRAGHPAHRSSFTREGKRRPMGAAGGELRGVNKQGEEFPVDISLSPIESEDGMLFVAAVRVPGQ